MQSFYELLSQKEQKINDDVKRVILWERKKHKPDYRKVKEWLNIAKNLNGTKKGISQYC